jgi:hypothetical protein
MGPEFNLQPMDIVGVVAAQLDVLPDSQDPLDSMLMCWETFSSLTAKKAPPPSSSRTSEATVTHSRRLYNLDADVRGSCSTQRIIHIRRTAIPRPETDEYISQAKDSVLSNLRDTYNEPTIETSLKQSGGEPF